MESFTFLPSTFRTAFCSNRNFQETWHISRELRLDGRVGFLNEHQEKVHLGAISHGLHDTACCVSRLILCWQPWWIIRLDLWVTIDNLISAQLALTGTTLWSDQKRNLKQRRHKRWVFNTLSQHFLSPAILVPTRHYFTLNYVLSPLLLSHYSKKCLS